MRFLLALVSICLLVSCSSGSGGGKSKHSDGRDITRNEPDKYTLGGVVSGLDGDLALQLGDETLNLSSDSLPEDGSFSFQTKLVSGSGYDVQIASLPENQLCDIRRSKGFILNNRNDVKVNCARMVAVDVVIDVPSTYELSDLRLLSNYQAKGGNAELPIDASTTNLLVFNNSFMSLRNQSGKLIYLGFIDDTDKGTFKLNALSTALSLILLDPTVANAIHDRGLKVADLLADLKTAVSVDNALNDLVGEIALLAESRKDLLIESGSLIADLQRVLDLSVAYLETLPLPAQTEIASLGEAGKSVVELASAGVKFEYLRAPFDEDVLLSVSNERHRYVAISNDKLGNLMLAPGEHYDATLAGGIEPNTTVDFYLSGLGKGDLPTAQESDYLKAARLSGLKQRFLPSVKLMLGLTEPADFPVSDCLSESDINNLLSALDTSALNSAFLESRLSEAFLTLNHLARKSFVKVQNNSSPLGSLFACDKLGVGLLFDEQKAIAKDNISGILHGLETVFNPASGLQGLLGTSSATKLNKAIDSSVRAAQWQLSNFLQLNIDVQPTADIYSDQELSFKASCIDPNAKTDIDCTVAWTFGDGATGSGTQLPHSYQQPGVYTVTATARDNDGATNTQSLQIEVLPFNPELKAFVASLPLSSGALACNFGVVTVGENRSCEIEFFNQGEGDLIFQSTSGSSGDYAWSIAQNPVSPQSNTMMTVEFSPSSVGLSSMQLMVASNDPAVPNFAVQVQGKGQINMPSSGDWEINSGAETISFSAVRQLMREVQQGDSTYLDLQFFADASASYPQLRLLLPYDRSNPDQRYSLDDAAGSECLGFFASSAGTSTSFCTHSSGLFSEQPVSGYAEISSTDTSTKSLLFEFNAVPLDCVGPQAACVQVSVSGTLSIANP